MLDLLCERLTPAGEGPRGLPAAEAALLERINEALPETTWACYEALKQKRDAETLTDAEHAELWPKAVAVYKGYEGYQKKTERKIPLVILETR